MADKVKERETPAKGKIRVFVYGTLKGTHANHGVIESAGGEFVKYDSITGPIRMTDMVGFPGVFRPNPKEFTSSKDEKVDVSLIQPMSIRGEIWALEPEGLMSLDLLEGHPSFYRREKWWTDGEVKCWVYLLSPQAVERGYKRGWLDPERRNHEGIWRPTDAEKNHWSNAA